MLSRRGIVIALCSATWFCACSSKDPRTSKVEDGVRQVRNGMRGTMSEALQRNDVIFVEAALHSVGGYVKGLPGGEHDLDIYKIPLNGPAVEIVPAAIIDRWPEGIGLFLNKPGRPWSVVIKKEGSPPHALIEGYGDDLSKRIFHVEVDH